MRKSPKIKRPFATHYFREANADEGGWVSQGACKTEDGAKAATVVRVILHQYDKAMIYDRRTGVLLLTYRRTPTGITEHFGRAEHRLQKVK